MASYQLCDMACLPHPLYCCPIPGARMVSAVLQSLSAMYIYSTTSDAATVGGALYFVRRKIGDRRVVWWYEAVSTATWEHFVPL